MVGSLCDCVIKTSRLRQLQRPRFSVSSWRFSEDRTAGRRIVIRNPSFQLFRPAKRRLADINPPRLLVQRRLRASSTGFRSAHGIPVHWEDPRGSQIGDFDCPIFGALCGRPAFPGNGQQRTLAGINGRGIVSARQTTNQRLASWKGMAAFFGDSRTLQPTDRENVTRMTAETSDFTQNPVNENLST
jgi:hypothetical protein